MLSFVNRLSWYGYTRIYAMKKLIEYQDCVIQRGQIIKCQMLDETDSLCLMLCEVIGERHYQLLIVSGYKAGLHFTYLPLEAVDQQGFGINAHWLIHNWHIWGYNACPLEQVYILHESYSTFFNY